MALTDEQREALENYRPIDDRFMEKLFEDIDCVKEILYPIFNKKLDIISAQTQTSLKNLQGRSIRLDILAKDKLNKLYNIEIQRADEGADPKRARYNSSLLDANASFKSEKYNELAETYVIFITENDVLEGDLPKYTITRKIEENNKKFEDGSNIIYINGQNKDIETDLGKLMHDFYCSDSKDMYNKKIAERTEYLKHDKKGVKEMEMRLEAWEERAAEKAAKKAEKKAILNIAKKLLIMNSDLKTIQEATGLSEDEIENLKHSLKN